MHKRRKIISAVVAIIFCFNLFIAVQAYSVYDYIDLNYQMQAKSLWCWAACSSVILHYYDDAIDQWSFCYYVFGNTNNQPASMEDIQYGLSTRSISSTISPSYLSYNAIKNQINYYSRPVLAGWSWNAYPFGGHALLLDAYDSSSGDYVNYMDPADGDAYYVTYAWFKGGSGYSHSWLVSLYQIY